MRKLFVGLLSLTCMSAVWAQDQNVEPLLNKVTLQLSAEQWVTSKTALVSVGISASVAGSALEKIHGHVLAKLGRLSNKAEWHLVNYYRAQDKSGLESIQITAQARLADSELSGLRDKAKSISSPGETYSIDNIQFAPSDDEIRTANATLRDNVYAQAKAELERLNKMYPEQKYYMHDVNFLAALTPVPIAQNAMIMKMGGDAAGSSALAVGDKLRIVAAVVLAAAPDATVVKLVHN